MPRRIIILLFLIQSFSAAVTGQKVILVTPHNNFYSLDILSGSCTTNKLFDNHPDTGFFLRPYSIALYKDTLYSCTEDGLLYRRILGSTLPPEFLTVGVATNALTTDKNGNLFYIGIDNSLVEYDPSTNVTKTWGYLNYSSFGDLIFFNDKLILSTNQQSLVEVNINHPELSTVYLSTPAIGFVGLLNFANACNQNTIYGIQYTSTGDSCYLVEIDMVNKKIIGTYCTIPLDILDAASITENGGYEGVTIDSIVRPFCTGALDKTSVRVYAYTASASPLVYSINGIDSNNNGQFNNLINGSYLINIKNNEGCFKDTLIHIDLSAKISVSLAYKGSNCDPHNGEISIKNETNLSPLFYSLNNSPFTTNSFYNNLGTGLYFIEIKDTNYCFLDTLVSLGYIKKSLVVNLGNDTSICSGETITLSVTDKNVQYLWQDGSTQSTYIVSKEGIYSLQITDTCGIGSDSVNIKLQNCDCNFYTPTAFTPNNDGVNGVFKAINNCTFKKFRLSVFNRWGKKVFMTLNKNTSWDGTIKGLAQPADVYLWTLEYFDTVLNKLLEKKGQVTLIR